jgi:diacylglycerol kinase
MVPTKKNHTIGLNHAVAGVRYALRTQTNFVIHVLVTAVVFLLAFILEISQIEWMILILTVFFVMTTELINSAIELWVDAGILEINIYAKRVKDIAAAAVVMSVVASLLIGAILFVPKLLPLVIS